MKRYNVGDQVWWARCGTRQVTKTCPVCFGKLKVTLILGNDDTVILPCDYCGKGYEGPRGTVEEYEYLAEPEQTAIITVNTHESADGEKLEYHTVGGYYHDDGADLYNTREDAVAICTEIVQRKTLEESTRVESLKKHLNKNYSWNAGYHMRYAARYERDALYHKEKAVLCKARAKENKSDGNP